MTGANQPAQPRVLPTMSVREPVSRTPPPSVLDDQLGYWWRVCRGEEIMRAFHAAPEPEAWRIVERHPALLLPELVDAA